MKILTCSVGSYLTNCYLLIDEKSGEAAAVDCAVYDDDYRFFIENSGIKELKYILLTHGHFDHVCGVKQLKENYGGRICIHHEDAACLSDEKESLNFYSKYGVQEAVFPDETFDEGTELYLGEEKLTVMHTPGHTKGSVCFLSDCGIMLSGDTLFRCSMGRTDMPGGSTRTLFQSLRRLGQLEGDYAVYPGHGEKTSLSWEKENNRYLRAK